MNKRTTKKVTGAIALYYGISGVAAALAATIGTGVWLFKVVSGNVEFSWSVLLLSFFIVTLSGLMGYSFLRVGSEEMED